MDHSTMLWLLAGVLVIAELLTGTFYLLMLAVGAIVGALASYLGLGTVAQIVAAALLGSVAVLACYFLRKRSPRRLPASSPGALPRRQLDGDGSAGCTAPARHTPRCRGHW